MGNRKNRHNVNEIRVIKSQNSDLSGYDKMFMFAVEIPENGANTATRLQLLDLFGTDAGPNTDNLQFNFEVYNPVNGVRKAYNHNSVAINDINDDFAAPSVVSGIDTGDLAYEDFGPDLEVYVYIKGQFNSLYFFDGVSKSPTWGSDMATAGENFGVDGYEIIIKQWGKTNEINNWERFCKAQDGSVIGVEATDEPQFAQGVSLYRAFEDTFAAPVFRTADALAAVESWDSNKFGNGQRVFENGLDQPNLNKWSFSGGDMSYGFYMRNNMSSITNGGDNMIPSSIAGFAGYASEAFSDSFQGATGIHNWEKLNTSQVVDAQYFAWENTRCKSLGTMENLDFSKCTNFTAMFGKAGVGAAGSEDELLIDPSNWDMKSAETVFYMFGIELPDTSAWAGELNWKTMKNVIDIHSVVKNRNNYTGARLDEFAQYSGNVVLFRSAFAKTAINHDFSNWNFSGVDARRTDVQLNENNSSGIMGGFVRDCEQMSVENTVKLLEAWDRPFGQGGLPVSGVDPEIGTAAQTIDFGSSYQTREAAGEFDSTDDQTDRANEAILSLEAKGYSISGLDFWK